MTDEVPPRDELIREERSASALIAGSIAGAGAMLGPPLAVLTDHFLNGGNDEPPPPQVELPPGVPRDD
jgi:hypothetical protein